MSTVFVHVVPVKIARWSNGQVAARMPDGQLTIRPSDNRPSKECQLLTVCFLLFLHHRCALHIVGKRLLPVRGLRE